VNRVLVIYTHPYTRKSLVNRAMREAIPNEASITIHDLYDKYPDFHIDVAAEQAALVAHDVIVLQHPFYWYSCPALLKEWIDAVFTFGFAYGTNGEALKGKYWMQAISTGGPADAYHRDGNNHFTIEELLRPFEQTAYLCGMRPLQPFLIQGIFKKTEAEISLHAQNYANCLRQLVDGQLPPVYGSL